MNDPGNLLKALIACLLACSCGRLLPDSGESYDGAVRALRNGNAAQALGLARLAEKRCGPREECSWSSRLLEAEVLLSDGQEVAAVAALSAEPPKGPQFAALAARRTWLLGDLEFSRGHPDHAEVLLDRAAEMASSAGAWDVGFEVGLSRGRLLFVYRHDADQAETIFRKVADQADRRRDDYHEAAALNGIGMMRLKEWRFDEAIPWFQKTTEAAKRGGVQRLIVAAGQNLAICYSQLGSFEEAIKSRQQAIALLGETGLAPYRMDLAWEMGNTYFEQRNPSKAVEFYRQALTLAVADTDKAKVHRTLARAYIDMQDWDDAEKSNNTALSYGNNDESRAWVEQNAAAIAAGRGRYQEACNLYRKTIQEARNTPIVLWESYAALAMLHTVTKDYPKANVEFEKAIEVIDNNSDKISIPDYRLTFFSRVIEFYQHYVQSLMAQRDYQRALEVADSSRARILLERLSSHRTLRRSSASDYLKIARASHSVLLFYWIAPAQSYLWVVTPARIYPPFQLPPAAQIRGWVDRYRAFVEQRIGDPMASENESGRHLYESLIAPAAELIPPGSRVILFPDDALNWLSFETLPVYGKTSKQKPHYWIEDVRPVLGPSLAVLNTEEEKARRAPDSMLIIGDPVSADPEFPKLEFASKEIQTIEAQFPSARKKVFTGSAARPDAYREAGPAGFSLLHFSAHAVANRESPLNSAIILSGSRDNYKLYARSIIDTPLQADLVTISACRGAGARSYLGEGLVGFTWAFLQAGARNVIAGLWDVTDSSTPAIMSVLYSKIASGANPADALRDAKLSIIHSAQGYHRPYYWGPLEIYTRDVRQFASSAPSRAATR